MLNDPAREWSITRPAPRTLTAVASVDSEKPRVGVVVIGRNEGERLLRCLSSVTGAGRLDGPIGRTRIHIDDLAARAMDVATVELDLRIPFAPGRARNEGYRRLRELVPELDYVQFVDGDCEVNPGWLEQASAFLTAHHDVAAVGGRISERYPERSVYNKLCAMEWDTHPIGEAKACGGVALMRADAFEAADGYRLDLMAGEEPELCERLRAIGWRIWFLDAPLAIHDAAMLRFSQWWKRAARSGYGHTQRAFVCPTAARLEGLRDPLSTWAWVVVAPVIVVALSWSWSLWALALLLLYPAQIIRVAARSERREAWAQSLLYSTFLMLAKAPKLIGQLTFLRYHWSRHPARLIEYKS